jgi:protein-tyrosine phosphatase
MRLDWPECDNVRDVGGLPTMDGGVTRSGALIRADGLFRLTADGVAAVRAAGVSRMLDLRRPAECARSPSPFRADPAHRHVPLIADVLPYDPPHDTYAPMLDHNGARIARAFRELAAAPRGGVVVFCQVGRDRTGTLVALALAVAGVHAEAIVDDYGLSPERDPVAMRNTIDHLAERYGGAEPYLRGLGVPPVAIEAVRHRLTSG